MRRKVTPAPARPVSPTRTLAAMVLTPWLALQGCAKQEDPKDAADKTASASQTKRRIHAGLTETVRDASGSEYVAGQLIVRFKSGTSNSLSATTHAKLGATVRHTYRSQPELQVVQVDAAAMQAALAAYRADPRVAYAQPNFVYHMSATPNDTRFNEMWGLNNTGQSSGTADVDINAPEAWALTTGSDSAGVVTVIDTGVDYTHPDLAENIWVNPGEIAGNGVDDDNNGYIDDVHGINAITGTGDPMDDNEHGTHVSGTIGARGNNAMGVTGVNWTAKVMACKFLDADGNGTDEDALECLDYVHELKHRTRNPVNVIATSNSYGGGDFSQAFVDSIAQQRDDGTLFIAAAGNDTINNDTSTVPSYPATFFLSNIISVAAHDRTDKLASFSSYGRRTVHVSAPGVDILSTVPGGGYDGTFSGTSMATPHVAGLVALLNAQDPSRDWRQLKNLVLTGGVSSTAVTGKTLTGKRLRAADVGGKGSLTCADQVLNTRVRPLANTVNVGLYQPVQVIAYNIKCGVAIGTPTITVSPSTESVSLTDTGTLGDEVAGDGMYTGYFEPSSAGAYTLTFPDGEVLTVNVSAGYVENAVPMAWRTITGTNLNLGDDTAVTITSPFGIPFGGGAAVTSLAVGMNGGMQMKSATAFTFTNAVLPYTTYTGGIVAPFWDDLYPGPTTADNVFWAVTGTAPNRELVIEWRNVHHRSTRTVTPANTVNFQVVFFEGKSDILYNYKDVLVGNVTYDKGASATVGVQVTTTVATQHSLNTASVQDGSAILWTLPSTATAPVMASLTASPESVSEGEALTLNANFSDADGASDAPFRVEYDLDYQGTFTTDATQSADAPGDVSTSATVRHSGTVTVAARATDRRGTRSKAFVAPTTVTVLDVPPTLAPVTPPAAINELQAATFTTSFTDPGLDAPWRVQWDWDYDGATFAPDETINATKEGPVSAAHTFARDGSYTVAVRITDKDGVQSNLQVLTVTVADLKPIIAPIATPSAHLLESQTLEFSSTLTDPGDHSKPWKVQWDFHYDGTTFNPESEDNFTAEGAIRAKRSMDDSGTYTYALRVVDADGSISDVQTLEVIVDEVSPKLRGYEARPLSTREGEPRTVAFTLNAESGADIADLDAIRDYLWDFDGDGVFDYVSYTPEAIFTYRDNPAGGDTYTATVRVEDEDSYTDATVSVVVRNEAPTLASLGEQNVNEGRLLVTRALATDPGTDALTFSLRDAPEGMSITADGLLFWAPTSAQAGEPSRAYAVTVTVTDDDGDSSSQVVTFNARNVAPTLAAIDNRSVNEGSLLSARALASDPGNGTLRYSLSGAPEGMSITADGLIFWTPAFAQTSAAGTSYTVTVTVKDEHDASASQSFTVSARWVDTDGDGMPDTWERSHGTDPLRDDAADDSDGDGVSNRDEFNAGNGGPTLPGAAVAKSPLSGSQVDGAELVLTASNAKSVGSLAAARYQFQLFADAALTEKVRDETVDQADGDTTSASLTDGTESVDLADLMDNHTYAWRVRVTDGTLSGPWSQVQRFRYNPVNDLPGAPRSVQPMAGSQVSTLTPVLVVDNVVDADDATVTYLFEVAEDAAFTKGVQASAAVAAGERGNTSWAVAGALKPFTSYFWRVTAVDPHGGSRQGEVSSFSIFIGRPANHAPGAPALVGPAQGESVASATPVLVASLATDTDGDALSYVFELDTSATFGGTARQVSSSVEAVDGKVGWTPASLQENTRYYWRVRALDAASAGDWVIGTFVVNAKNDAPSAPVTLNPSEAIVATRKPTLTVQNAVDPEGDAVTYAFEVRKQGSSDVVASASSVAAGANGVTSVTLTTELEEGAEYVWVARATDAQGAASAASAEAGFMVFKRTTDDPGTHVPDSGGCSASPGDVAGLLPMLALGLGLLGRRRRR
jgi:uncharacterized protein (TIGR03382 family)